MTNTKTTRKFTPAFGLKNRHFQTIYSSFFRKKIKLDYQIEEFTLSDGDFIECYWLNKIKASTNIFVIFHGLEGSYTSPYIKGIMKALEDKNQAVVLVHFRSCGKKTNKKAKTYHSGDSTDAIEYLKYLHFKYPNTNILTIGYSLGGNMMLKLLGKDFIDNFIKKSICISAPLDLSICAKVLDSGFSQFYQKHLLKLLKESLIKKYEDHDYKKLIGLDRKRVDKISSIKEFDELYTSKINDFGSAENYYKVNSSKQFLKNIKTKTLLIHSLDDPFMNEKILPDKDEVSKYCTFEIYENGGHLGFIEGSVFNPKYMLEKRIIEYFTEYY
jgi:predicted alpha/beta-fold hydrolase